MARSEPNHTLVIYTREPDGHDKQEPGANMTTSPVMRWLAEGLPLTLLCDLVSTADPDSAAIMSVERPTGDPIWQDAAATKTAWRQAASE
jgi:hypothetical protein